MRKPFIKFPLVCVLIMYTGQEAPGVAQSLQTPRQSGNGGQGDTQSPSDVQSQTDDDEDEVRRLWDESLLQRRARGTTRRKNFSYRRVTPRLRPGIPPKSSDIAKRKGDSNKAGGGTSSAPVAAVPGDWVIGVTFWRLRPSTGKDEARLLVQKPGSAEALAYTPERIAAGTPLDKGQLVRISIESPSDGFLYVFDREKYADRSLGEPYLIFPTSRTYRGNNAVKGGNVVEIPAQDEPPFEVAPTSSNVVGEVLTIILSPKRLGLPLKESMYELSSEQKEQFKTWEKQWLAPSERLEQEGGAGTAYTSTEQKAGKGEAQLTQGDPLPQTIYHVVTKPDAPFLLLSVPLNYGPAKSPMATERFQEAPGPGGSRKDVQKGSASWLESDPKIHAPCFMLGPSFSLRMTSLYLCARCLATSLVRD